MSCFRVVKSTNKDNVNTLSLSQLPANIFPPGGRRKQNKVRVCSYARSSVTLPEHTGHNSTVSMITVTVLTCLHFVDTVSMLTIVDICFAMTSVFRETMMLMLSFFPSTSMLLLLLPSQQKVRHLNSYFPP